MVGLVEKQSTRRLLDLSDPPANGENSSSPCLNCGKLFGIFFKAGLAFGGGPGILAALDREMVERRRLVSREDLMTVYALSRVVPSGTMTGVAIAYGHRFAGFPGTVAALAGLVTPGASLTILLTVGYAALRNSTVLPVLAATVLPAALAFIVAAAVRFGRVIPRPSLDLVVAAASLIAAAFFQLHPFAILLTAGVVGVLAFREEKPS